MTFHDKLSSVLEAGHFTGASFFSIIVGISTFHFLKKCSMMAIRDEYCWIEKGLSLNNKDSYDAKKTTQKAIISSGNFIVIFKKLTILLRPRLS